MYLAIHIIEAPAPSIHDPGQRQCFISNVRVKFEFVYGINFKVGKRTRAFDFNDGARCARSRGPLVHAHRKGNPQGVWCQSRSPPAHLPWVSGPMSLGPIPTWRSGRPLLASARHLSEPCCHLRFDCISHAGTQSKMYRTP